MKRITLERSYKAELQDIWDLWTTREGFESWWGPGGFSTKVLQLDLRPGGKLVYAMTAVGAEQIAFMDRAGMPRTTQSEITFVNIEPMRGIAYTTRADFIPGVQPYDFTTQVNFHVHGESIRMVISMDAMHDALWTERAAKGMESQLEKLTARFPRA